MEAKTIERHIDCGKWRMRIEGGMEATDVRLKGARNRRIGLLKLDNADFRARLPRTPEDKVREDMVLRGVPLYWNFYGTEVQIWPAPAHEWDIEIDVRPK